MSNDLVARLRDPAMMKHWWDQYGMEAADEIERLQKQLAESQSRLADCAAVALGKAIKVCEGIAQDAAHKRAEPHSLQARYFHDGRDDAASSCATAINELIPTSAERVAAVLKNDERYRLARLHITPRSFSDSLLISWTGIPNDQPIAEKVDELCDAALSASKGEVGGRGK